MIKRIILCVVLIVLGFVLTSCQTVEGLGEDIKWTSEQCAALLGGE